MTIPVRVQISFSGEGTGCIQKYLADYLRTVAAIDDSVKALLNELEKQGVLDDTIVIYTSDQGMFLGEHDYQDKRWNYEESLRAPFLIRYPKETHAGTSIGHLMVKLDVTPTLQAYAGTKVSLDVQGISAGEMLAGGAIRECRLFPILDASGA